MPSSTGVAHGGSGGASGLKCLAVSTPSNTNGLLRPTSAKSTRSASPLLHRWARHGGGKENQHPPSQLPQAADFAGRKSTSSSCMSTSTGAASAMAPPPTTKRRDSQSGLPPPLTTEEFEALPVAIQRKYFSTLERLRFARSSGAVDGIFDHYCQTSKRRRPRQERSVSEHLAGRMRRRSLRESSSLLSPDSLAFASNLPDKIKRRQFTREEQVVLARHLRASVILDAADEAVYKVGRRASRQFSLDPGSPISAESSNLFSSPSMDTLRSDSSRAHDQSRQPDAREAGHRQSGTSESFYDSFRWLDEEDDLDLRLFLDDYHAGLREALPCPSEDRRPSFRRHLSISKIPFGRSSLTASRPATKDASHTSTPLSPVANPPSSVGNGPPIARRRSRTLSLIKSKHPQDAVSPIDPAAAHYQDPEARLKLRVYLASPQKFDEAIEFGFPSAEALSTSPVIKKDSRYPQKREAGQEHPVDSSKMETFLADDDDDEDKISNGDQMSMADPDSPKTPHSMERPVIRSARLPTFPVQKPAEGYAQAPASSREMTLRMTLTRPDLRASEHQIYGWKQQELLGQHQAPAQQSSSRRSQSIAVRDDLARPIYVGAGGYSDPARKESIEKVLAGMDHWSPEPDRGVMKRIWHRVRRS